MKKTTIFFLLTFIHLTGFTQDPERLYEMGKNYLKDGDYPNAEMLLSKVYDKDTMNGMVRRDLALCYYYQNDFKKALNLVEPVVSSDTADEQYYVLASDIYKSVGQNNLQEKTLRAGIKKFTSVGRMYNELGTLLKKQNNKEAISLWESGIENDPLFAKNYFDASMYYNENNERFWSVIYAEIFLNMDPVNNRNAELKERLLANYKKILTDIAAGGFQKEKNDLLRKIIRNLRKQNIPSAIDAPTLMMIRTKFILSWFNDNPDKTPFYLFDYQRNLLQNGIYEAYNQWLFGSSENLVEFHKWTKSHDSEYGAFIRYQKSFLSSFPKDQYYH